MKLNIFDSHVHTDSSPDGEHSLVYMCETAIKKGVMGFSVTDHYDCDMAERYQYYSRMKQSLFQFEKARASFGSEIRLTKGIELSQGHRCPIEANRAMALAAYDFVLATIHTVPPYGDLYEVNFDDPNIVIADILNEYYQDNLQMAQWNKFDSLGHLGYGERYIWVKYRIPVQIEPYMDVIDEILKTLIQNGKSLELNTSGYRQNLGRSIPSEKVFRRYKELGGEMVTIGSDAHRGEDIGADIDEAMDLLLELGFKYFAFYNKREPIMLKLL